MSGDASNTEQSGPSPSSEPGRPSVPAGVSILPERLVVTIDGQAATGKSSTGLRLARALNAAFLDTGAMYRDATALALENHVPPHDAAAIVALVRAARAEFDWVIAPSNSYRPFDRAFNDRLRTGAVDDAVSVVAKHEPLRALLIEWQRQAALDHKRLVSEGRDQGSRVFKDEALAKVFLMADPAERARRRVEQLARAGITADTAVIEKNLRLRDALDASHSMKVAEGMKVIDTTRLSEDEVVRDLAAFVAARAAAPASEARGRTQG